MTHKYTSLTSLRDVLRKFAIARDWQQFHTPKNLAMALRVRNSMKHVCVAVQNR